MKKKIKQKIIDQWGKPKDRNFRFDLIDQYNIYKKSDETSSLNEKTIIDLDIHEYFQFIDRTNSSVGQQYLYHKIIENNLPKDDLERQEKLVNFYNSNTGHRLESQIILNNLSKSEDYYFPFLIFGDLPEKMKYYWIIPLLQSLLVISFFLFFKFSFFFIPIILLIAIHVGFHYWHKNRIENFAVYFSRITKLSSTLKKLLPLTEINEPEKSKHIEDLHRIDKITSQVLFLKTNDLQQSEIGMVVWFIFELFKIITLSEIVIFHKLVDRISISRTELENLFMAIGKIDLAISIGSLRAGLPFYSIPNFLEQIKELKIKDLYHPLIPACVSNDIHLKNKSLLLTGSNMAGKSTFIKAININILTSQVLNTSFSNLYAAPIWRLMTSMTIKDDLTENSSYYMEEVYSIQRLLKCSEKLDQQYLFTIDEIFKGTNTIERISTAKAILEYLNSRNHLILVSTHDIELTKMLNDGFDLYYFQESITDNSLSFDYQLKKGILRKSNAIKILEITGYPTSITKEAMALANKLADEKTGQSHG